MKGDDLLADDHIVRYVKPNMIQEDGTPDGSGFRLRPERPDEPGLSINWLEALARARSINSPKYDACAAWSQGDLGGSPK